MKTRKITIIALALAVIFALSACNAADVVGKVSVTSFKAVLDKLSDKVAFDEANKSWALTSPGGERFLWARDFSGTPDAMLEFDATPFINAGLDPAKLPSDMYYYDKAMNKLMVHGEFGNDKFEYKSAPTPIDTFQKIVDTHRDIIGYHEKLDHYGVALGNGNMFEWAKNMSTNDKDIVFVLNPKPFIDAGVDPAKVTGWVFAKVEVKDKQGKPEQVDKFLKPYDIAK